MLKRALQVVIAVGFGLAAAGVASAAAPVSALSDDFDGSALAGWSQMQGDVADGAARASVADGMLTIHSARASWIREQRAFYLWKDIAGDFVATTRLMVTGESGGLPTADWSLAGLLVRRQTDDAARENWIGWTTGAVSGAPVFERKTTARSASVLRLIPARTGWVELRVARIGSVFFLLRRYPGERWAYAARYVRADLPRTLQVGLDAQSGYGNDFADLVAQVDYVHFAPTAVPAALRAKLQRTTAPTAALLRYLTRG
jgi:hypothetical protein